ncbi:hypothetical protein C1645_750835 [Glomus cerebriforme]|uniref:Cupredoxin n=1 Tax=Glomus cerebriforme TaxID=658196 RepID=A0A397S5T8_9GLOM|nr:hypothetical protein C1645_791675 [Glomus cerebriforme]RIA98180.1 hypothetical protein C1645_750835 [Glomus cerebriforme]
MSQRILKNLIFLILAFYVVDSIYAEIINIQVGGGGPYNLHFVPQNVTANKGDTIVWHFLGGDHSIVETDGKGSCIMNDNPSFGSMTNPPTGMYNMTIQSQKDIITYMCAFGSHCANGMWGIIYVGGTEPADFVKPTPTNKAKVTDAPVKEKNDTGKIVGIVIGSLSGFVIFTALGFLLAKRCKSKQRTVPTLEGIKRVDDNANQETKDNQAKLENV